MKKKIVLLLFVVLLVCTFPVFLAAVSQRIGNTGVTSLVLQVGLVCFTVALIALAFKKKGNYGVALCVLALICLVVSVPFLVASFGSDDRRLVGAYYYAWYTPERWQDTFHADSPLLCNYDSGNVTVIQQHLTWANDYGIDFLAVSLWEKWSSPNGDLFYEYDTFDNVKAVFEENKAMGDAVRLCVLVEPRTETELQSLADKAWQLTEYSGYLEWFSKPLLLVYTEYIGGLAQFSDSRFTVKFVPYDVPYFTEGLQTNLVGDTVSVKVGANVSYVQVDRENGAFYTEQWQGAIAWAKLNPQRNLMSIITSFNEWWESSELETSIEYGLQYLELTKEYATRFKQT